jgi:hypothetical protein
MARKEWGRGALEGVKGPVVLGDAGEEEPELAEEGGVMSERGEGVGPFVSCDMAIC